MIRFLETGIPGVILIEPVVHRDDRGFFLEAYHEPKYREGGIREIFVQDNHSRSTKGALRGLHGQNPNPQGKLVRVVERLVGVAANRLLDLHTGGFETGGFEILVGRLLVAGDLGRTIFFFDSRIS